MDIFAKYATTWADQQLGFGKESYERARAAGLSNLQIQQGLSGKRVGRIASQRIASGITSDLTSNFESAMAAQAAQFAEQRRRQEERMQQLQQQMVEAQTRQATPQQSAQVLGPGKSMVIRPGGSSRFSRPELQIKSVNI